MKNYLIHNLCSLEKEDGLFKMRIIERILLSYEGIEEKDAGVNFINTKVIATDPQVKDIQPSDSPLGRYRVYDNILYVNNDIKYQLDFGDSKYYLSKYVLFPLS